MLSLVLFEVSLATFFFLSGNPALYPRCFRTTWCSCANCSWQVTSFPG